MKTCQSKITLYLLNTPVINPKTGKEMNEYEMVSYIEDILAKHNILTSAPGEIITGEVEETNYTEERVTAKKQNKRDRVIQKTLKELEEIKKIDPLAELKDEVSFRIFDDCIKRGGVPVGYLDPEGFWHLRNSKDSGLVHLELADIIYDIAKDKGIKFQYCSLSRGNVIDDILEKNGYIKVHGLDVRYLAHFPCWDRSLQSEGFTPDMNENQRIELAKYLRRMQLLYKDSNVDLIINDSTRINRSRILQMDLLMSRKVFNL